MGSIRGGTQRHALSVGGLADSLAHLVSVWSHGVILESALERRGDEEGSCAQGPTLSAAY